MKLALPVCCGLLLAACAPAAQPQAASAVPAQTQAPAPAPVEVQGRLPDGSAAAIRLVFRQGVQVETAQLPAGFLARPFQGPWVPFAGLSPAGKRWALQALFPDDSWEPEQVQHRVRWPELESIWLMASLFTGHGQRYDRLQAVNPSNPEKLAAGDLWVVPRVLLAEDLGGEQQATAAAVQPEEGMDDAARLAAYRAMLSFGRDDQGRYAGYRLRKGEALYSSVVMRYTDQVDPQGVNELAMVIARRSGIEDVRGIQPGTLVKIPVEALADPFQPEGSRALAEEREVQAEIRRTPRLAAGARLKGVRIVLDAGHGGIDKGASANGVWESDYVYDITMRVRRLLVAASDARVSCTTSNPEVGFNVRSRIPAPTDQAEVLTTPPFPNDGENPIAVSVHLRWVLANQWFAAFDRTGDARKTLFISFHADSLHPSARGTMVYVPGASLVPASFNFPASRLVPVRELAGGARVRFSAAERLQDEAHSRLFGQCLLRTLQSNRVLVHDDRPIRNVVLRGGQSFVPAVIRYNRAATKVLLEVLNLTNPDDAENLRNPDWRERFAQAVVQGIQAYYRS